MDDITSNELNQLRMSHDNYVHAGVEIPSMSQIIMNKVFSCAGDCNVEDLLSRH